MPPMEYHAYQPRTHPSGAPLNSIAPTLRSVKDSLKAIHDSGDFLGISVDAQIPNGRYTSGRTHFQGIQRLQNTRYLVLSGGDDKLGCGNLFVAKLESRDPASAWRSNLINKDQLPAGGALDRIVLTLNVNDAAHGVDSRLWHVGGISTSGDILAAPVESPDGGSVILFYNFQIPEQPTLLARKFRIKRPHAMTGAVAITDLPNGHTLVAALGNHDNNKQYLDFYLTKQPNWTDGFTLINSHRLDDGFPSCQNINFIKSVGGELFMIGTGNRIVAPIFNTDDSAYLFKIGFGGKTLAEVIPSVSIANQVNECEPTCKLKNKVFWGRGTKRERKFTPFQSNMSAAGGAYIHPQGALFIYSSYHWRDPKDKSRIRLTEFRPDPSVFTADTIQSVHDCWIDMFVDSDYNKIRLGLSGASDTAISDLRGAAAQGHIFGKSLSSLRCQIPPDKKLVLYARKNFETRDGFEEIFGEGKMTEEPDMKKLNFGDKALSCRVIPIHQPA